MIGAGFGRTGTTSIKAALETLGFTPCYHMTEVFAHPEHADLWLAAYRGEPVDWEGFLGGYRATVDWPGCAFYGEMMEAFPDAKVLLSVRDPERWYQSTRDTIYEMNRVAARSRASRTVFGLMTLLFFGGFMRTNLTGEMVWDGAFDGRFEDRDHAIGVFEKHNEEVRRRVPPERLLVYEVEQGWGPLCDFLGVPEPHEPFPRLNDAAGMRRGTAALRVLSAAAPAALFLLPAAALYALLFAGRRRPNFPVA